jgi:hypothetical protein
METSYMNLRNMRIYEACLYFIAETRDEINIDDPDLVEENTEEIDSFVEAFTDFLEIKDESGYK